MKDGMYRIKYDINTKLPYVPRCLGSTPRAAPLPLHQLIVYADLVLLSIKQ